MADIIKPKKPETINESHDEQHQGHIIHDGYNRHNIKVGNIPDQDNNNNNDQH